MSKVKPITAEELPLVLEVFEYWKEVLGYSARKLTHERASKIVARLRSGFTVEELKRVIRIVSTNAWWRGKNNNNKPYDDIINIFRNDTRTETFLEGSTRNDHRLSATEESEHEGFTF